MKTILLLPGSKWQLQLAKKIKELGFRLIVVSPEQNPSCREIADLYLQSDIFDIKRILDFCKDKEINGVLSDECDIAMPVVAEFGEKFSVPTLTKDSASLYTNKYLMREFCKLNGINCPDYRLCRTMDDANKFFREQKSPIIIKPLDSNASHGVFTIYKESDLERYFEESMRFSKCEKAVLAERYIEGTEFTIDGIKTPFAHYSLAISEKKHFSYNKNIAFELFFTHQNHGYDYQKLKTTNDRFIMNSDLRYGFTHAEYKYNNGRFYLIEIAARGGGNQISALITQYLTGYDTYRYLIECALGNEKNVDFSIPGGYKDRAAVLHFFHVPHGGGKVKAIHGEEFLRNNEAIIDYALNFSVGDTIRDASNDSVRIGYYIAVNESEAKLRKTMQEIERNFKIETE